MLVKFEQIRIFQTARNLEPFDKNRVFLNRFWQGVDAILKEVSTAEIII